MRSPSPGPSGSTRMTSGGCRSSSSARRPRRAKYRAPSVVGEARGTSMEPKMVLPGDQIAVAEEFEPGEGTYEKNGLVFASTPGVLHLDETSRVARVRPFNPPAELQPGDIVYAVVDDIRGMMATASVSAIHGRARQVSGETNGTIHISNVSEEYTEDIRDKIGRASC